MLEPGQAAAMLDAEGIAGMDDPTEPHYPYRWYWNRITGELNWAGHNDPCPKAFPEYRNIRCVIEQADRNLETDFI